MDLKGTNSVLCCICRSRLSSACRECHDYSHYAVDASCVPEDIAKALTVPYLLTLSPNARLAIIVTILSNIMRQLSQETSDAD